MSLVYEFDDVERLATGAIGEPGQRTFFIQVKANDTVLSVKCEKQQVAVISTHIRNLLEDLPEPSGPTPDADFVLDPTLPDFVLGTVGIGYDRSGGRIFLQFDELIIDPERDDGDTGQLLLDDFDTDDTDILDGVGDDEGHEDDDGDGDAPDSDRIRLFVSPAQARAFCDAADTAVAGGREPCRWCGAPKDPRGHACPRLN